MKTEGIFSVDSVSCWFLQITRVKGTIRKCHGVLCSIPGQSVWDWWWTDMTKGQNFPPNTPVHPVSLSLPAPTYNRRCMISPTDSVVKRNTSHFRWISFSVFGGPMWSVSVSVECECLVEEKWRVCRCWQIYLCPCASLHISPSVSLVQCTKQVTAASL